MNTQKQKKAKKSDLKATLNNLPTEELIDTIKILGDALDKKEKELSEIQDNIFWNSMGFK